MRNKGTEAEKYIARGTHLKEIKVRFGNLSRPLKELFLLNLSFNCYNIWTYVD